MLTAESFRQVHVCTGWCRWILCYELREMTPVCVFVCLSVCACVRLSVHTFMRALACVCPFAPDHVPEIQSYDGWYNNLAHPEWGGAGEGVCCSTDYMVQV